MKIIDIIKIVKNKNRLVYKMVINNIYSELKKIIIRFP